MCSDDKSGAFQAFYLYCVSFLTIYIKQKFFNARFQHYNWFLQKYDLTKQNISIVVEKCEDFLVIKSSGNFSKLSEASSDF